MYILNKDLIIHDITMQFIDKSSIENAVNSYFDISEKVSSEIKKMNPNDDRNQSDKKSNAEVLQRFF